MLFLSILQKWPARRHPDNPPSAILTIVYFLTGYLLFGNQRMHWQRQGCDKLAIPIDCPNTNATNRHSFEDTKIRAKVAYAGNAKKGLEAGKCNSHLGSAGADDGSANESQASPEWGVGLKKPQHVAS